MLGILIICGPSGSGKSSIGRTVAQKIGYTHWEMSDFVTEQWSKFERPHEVASTADFVETILWVQRGPGAVADPLAAFITASLEHSGLIRGVVVTGPRRREEIDIILSLGQPTVLVYLVVPFFTRLERARRKHSGPGVVRRVDFALRTEREEDWGLLREPVDHSFVMVSNDRPMKFTVNEVESLARHRLPV